MKTKEEREQARAERRGRYDKIDIFRDRSARLAMAEKAPEPVPDTERTPVPEGFDESRRPRERLDDSIRALIRERASSGWTATAIGEELGMNRGFVWNIMHELDPAKPRGPRRPPQLNRLNMASGNIANFKDEDGKDLARFANALREFLGLEPLYHDHSAKESKNEEKDGPGCMEQVRWPFTAGVGNRSD